MAQTRRPVTFLWRPRPGRPRGPPCILEGISACTAGFYVRCGPPRAVLRTTSSSSRAAQEAFEQEALSFLNRLYAAALRLTRNSADAEDLVQDTYLRAFRSAHQFQAGTNLRGWLFTILHNAHLNQRRDRARDPVEADSEAVELAAGLDEGPATPEEELLRSTLDADVKAALDGLPEAFREAVWLRDVEQFSYDEIARIVQVPIGTVMSRISRGRRLLHDALVARSERFAKRASAGGGETRPAGVKRERRTDQTDGAL